MNKGKLSDLNKQISGESYFSPLPGRAKVVENYGPLDKSSVWYLNHLFWKHFGLWQKTYNEHYEASLPSGVSESHKSDFVRTSAEKFYSFLTLQTSAGTLPKTVNVLEEGPGTGLYAKQFLDYLQQWSKKDGNNFYKRITYTLYDTSAEILEEAQKNMADHQAHIKVTTVFPKTTKFLFSRHSNLWDQLPVRLFKNVGGVISELETRLVLDKRLEEYLAQSHSAYTLEEIVKALKERRLEPIILKQPTLWKPLIRAIKIETKARLLGNINDEHIAHPQTFQAITQQHHNQEFTYSPGVLDNIDRLLQVTDWQAGGYIEIVDIIAPDTDAFATPRLPVKYDGSLGTVVNGLMVRAHLACHDKHLTLEQLKGLNYVATIREQSLKNLLAADGPTIIAEVAAATKQTANHIATHASELFESGVDVVSFSDQAFVKSEYLTLADIAESKIFKHLPGGSVLPVLKARTKTRAEIKEVTQNLKSQGVKNLFVVTGDPSGDLADTGLSSLDVIPLATKDFYIGSVAHPQLGDIKKMQAKIKAGANFFIMQASYDQLEWLQWTQEIKKQGTDKHIPIIATIIPLISPRVLDVVTQAQDIAMPTSIAGQFTGLDGPTFRAAGLMLAKAMTQTYLDSGIFSGIYLYSRSPRVIKEMNEFIASVKPRQ